MFFPHPLVIFVSSAKPYTTTRVVFAPGVLKTLAVRAAAAKEAATKALDLCRSLKAQAVSGGFALPAWAWAAAASAGPPGRAGAAAAAARALSSLSGPPAAAMAHAKGFVGSSSAAGSSSSSSSSSSSGGSSGVNSGPPELSVEQLAQLDEKQRRVHFHGRRALSLQQRHAHAARLLEVSRAIFNELQRSAWHLSSEFVDGRRATFVEPVAWVRLPRLGRSTTPSRL